MISRILLTGSDGMIGTVLKQKLLEQGHNVHGFGDDYNILNEQDWDKFKYNDYTDVIHLAALAGVRPSFDDPETYYKNNVDGFRNVLRFADKQKARLLYASSSNAYEWYGNPYATTKKINEIQAEGRRAIGMRFHTTWPGREDMLYRKLAKGEVSYINEDHHRDFIHVEDLTDAITQLMMNFNLLAPQYPVVDIGTGKSISVKAVAKMCGYEGQYKSGDAPGERIHTCANIEALTRIGWKPKVDILDEETYPKDRDY